MSDLRKFKCSACGIFIASEYDSAYKNRECSHLYCKKCVSKQNHDTFCDLVKCPKPAEEEMQQPQRINLSEEYSRASDAWLQAATRTKCDKHKLQYHELGEVCLDPACPRQIRGFRCSRCMNQEGHASCKPEFRFAAHELFEITKVRIPRVLSLLKALPKKSVSLSFFFGKSPEKVLLNMSRKAIILLKALSNWDSNFFSASFPSSYAFEMPHVSSY